LWVKHEEKLKAPSGPIAPTGLASPDRRGPISLALTHARAHDIVPGVT